MIALLVSVLFASSGFAATSWELATSAATRAYEADFQAEKGAPASAPLGLRIEAEGDELLTTVYFLESDSLRAFRYGCHEHAPGEFDCHREDRAELGSYGRSSSLYGAKEFQEAATLALGFFGANGAPLDSVRSVKFWEAETNIRFLIGYEKEGGRQHFYVGCHFHGQKMDCHRKRDAGPGEPEKN